MRSMVRGTATPIPAATARASSDRSSTSFTHRSTLRDKYYKTDFAVTQLTAKFWCIIWGAQWCQPSTLFVAAIKAAFWDLLMDNYKLKSWIKVLPLCYIICVTAKSVLLFDCSQKSSSSEKLSHADQEQNAPENSVIVKLTTTTTTTTSTTTTTAKLKDAEDPQDAGMQTLKYTFYFLKNPNYHPSFSGVTKAHGPSQPHADLQHAVWRLQQEVTRPKSGMDGGTIRCHYCVTIDYIQNVDHGYGANEPTP